MQTIRAGDGDWIGRAELTPGQPVVAGSTVDWQIRYTAGRYGVDDGGALKLSWRFASDWSDPQLTDPAVLTVADEAASGPTLELLGWLALPLVPAILGFQAMCWWVFRGRTDGRAPVYW